MLYYLRCKYSGGEKHTASLFWQIPLQPFSIRDCMGIPKTLVYYCFVNVAYAFANRKAKFSTKLGQQGKMIKNIYVYIFSD